MKNRISLQKVHEPAVVRLWGAGGYANPPLKMEIGADERGEKTQKWRERCIENAKNAEFSTFSTIKVRKSSLQFAKVVLLYKVRNFAERFAGFFTLFVFNKF